MKIAVAGGTGTVGRHVVDVVRETGHEPVVLTRSTGVDLVTGDGLADALPGVDVVVDVTSVQTMSDAASRAFFGAVTRNLLAAETAAGVRHHVALSIAGVDDAPYSYYAGKVLQEQLVEAGPVPWTILRATQFHDLLIQMFTTAARTGLLPVLAGTSFQPVALDDVADRLADLVDGPAQGRANDLGGPEVRPMADLARAWLAASGRRRALVPLRLPGAIARGYRDGAHLTPEHADGAVTFEQFLAARAEVTR